MFVRQLSKCKECPLRDRTRVWGQGATNGIAIIGEAPGQEEDADGQPFVGRAGKFLNWGLGSAGIPRQTIWTTNTICCRPPDNKINSEEARSAIECCKPGFDEELAWLARQGVKILVPVGGSALHALGVEGTITKVRGSVYLYPPFVVLPTFHPSYIMRAQFKKDTSEVTFKYVWIADFRKALRLLAQGWTPPREDFELSPDLAKVVAWADRVVARKALIGVDIETWQGKIFVIGLADGPEHAISVPIYRKGGYPYWHNGDWQEVKIELDRIFSTCSLMFQNSLFDVPYLKSEGFKVDFSRVQEDTMLLHHAISPELPHNLGFIVSTYGQTPYWKADFLKRWGSITEMDDVELRTYNLRDAVVMHQVLPGMLADLREVGSENVYREETLKMLDPVDEMVQTGFLLDQGKLEKLKAAWEKQQEILEAGLLKGLPTGFNLDSDDDLRWFLFAIKPNKFEKLEKLKEYADDTKTGKRKLRSGTKIHKELLSLQEVALEIRPIYLLPGWTGRHTKTGSVSVDKQGLLGYQIQLQNRLAAVKEYKHEKFKAEQRTIEKLLAWLASYREYAIFSKLISTYTSYPLGPDGRVHTQFLIHGTTTGRLSSRNPNLQNLPKKHEEARNPFVASQGCTLLSADYNNLEVRVLAYEVDDKALIRTLESGINIHDENTRILFGITPKDPRWIAGRRAAKIFMFGGISYGGSDQEIHEKISMEVPELPLTRRDYIAARLRWMAAHPAYASWASRVRSEVHLTRTSKTFMNRVRTLHGDSKDIEKEALNTPIQGGAAHIINLAMIRIHTRKQTSGLQAKLLVQVHDQLIYEVPNAELPLMSAIVREEMERPLEMHGQMRRFPVDISVGSSWGDLKVEEDSADGDNET